MNWVGVLSLLVDARCLDGGDGDIVVGEEVGIEGFSCLFRSRGFHAFFFYFYFYSISRCNSIEGEVEKIIRMISN